MSRSDWPISIPPSKDNLPAYAAGVVIPMRNGLKFFKLCFHSLLSFADWPYTLTVVDNLSNLHTRDYLRVLSRNHAINVIRYDEEFNFAAEVNRGVAKSFERKEVKFAVILQADAVVTPGFLSALINPFTEDKDLGIVSPTIAETNSGKDAGLSIGVCTVIRRRAWEELGGYDEAFTGCGFETTDFIHRAILAGWRMDVAANSTVFHFGAGFRRNDYNAAMAENEKRFQMKHAEQPSVAPASNNHHP